eukprot:COSAG02_NODE_7095_length_3188_cov_13.479922_3_plen_146_part_00
MHVFRFNSLSIDRRATEACACDTCHGMNIFVKRMSSFKGDPGLNVRSLLSQQLCPPIIGGTGQVLDSVYEFAFAFTSLRRLGLKAIAFVLSVRIFSWPVLVLFLWRVRLAVFNIFDRARYVTAAALDCFASALAHSAEASFDQEY